MHKNAVLICFCLIFVRFVVLEKVWRFARILLTLHHETIIFTPYLYIRVRNSRMWCGKEGVHIHVLSRTIVAGIGISLQL